MSENQTEKVIAEIDLRSGEKEIIEFDGWDEYSQYLDEHLDEIENAHGVLMCGGVLRGNDA